MQIELETLIPPASQSAAKKYNYALAMAQQPKFIISASFRWVRDVMMMINFQI